jgi:hypothetical protein
MLIMVVPQRPHPIFNFLSGSFTIPVSFHGGWHIKDPLNCLLN